MTDFNSVLIAAEAVAEELYGRGLERLSDAEADHIADRLLEATRLGRLWVD